LKTHRNAHPEVLIVPHGTFILNDTIDITMMIAEVSSIQFLFWFMVSSRAKERKTPVAIPPPPKHSVMREFIHLPADRSCRRGRMQVIRGYLRDLLPTGNFDAY
jgi:hypothetical protein